MLEAFKKMIEKTIHIAGVGEVLLVKSKRAKRVNIKIAPLKGVRVTVPHRVTFANAEKLVLEKKSWLMKHIPNMQKLEGKLTLFTPDTQFTTFSHELVFVVDASSELRAKADQTKLTIIYPPDTDFASIETQDFIRHCIVETYRREAKVFLPGRVRELATLHQFKFRSVHVKNAKTRWGSCSYDNKINLNLHLMRLPAHLRDYVILHELCHTQVKNHSQDFWDLMDKVSGNGRGLDKELDQWQIEVF
ncbi:protein of unknown function [Microscilla marina ATCC 23134]|uniref:YgjP-like metallopeptidase domain-containing protein n=2 Tax=Microscilla marina TaxID=1027 RepID=A1ZMQ2_MICM2|nr:protein of unknown function [Microscilla marina ATCC 23134]